MRCSPTRIVLAVLACIVGAVLALPMLLARKAEACVAPPLVVDAEAAAKSAQRIRPTDTLLDSGCRQLPGGLAVGGDEPDPPREAAAAVDDLPALEAQIALLVHLDLLPGRIDALRYEREAERLPVPFPAALTIIERRRYHLRP